MSQSEADEAVLAFVNDMHDLLAGHAAELHGFVLAEALATFVAGHAIPGDATATATLRAVLLEQHIEMVRRMVPARAAHIHGAEERQRLN